MGDPKFMLGVPREHSVDSDGNRLSKMSQVAFIEDAWREWGEYRKGKSAPKRPADGLKFTDDNGNIIVVEPEEYEANIDKGYRSLVGTVLWPARNAYPVITYAYMYSVVQGDGQAIRSSLEFGATLFTLPIRDTKLSGTHRSASS